MELDRNNLLSIVVLGVVLIAIILAAAQFVGEGTKSVISVSGTASVSVMPNKADIFVKIVSLEDNAADAQSVNAEISNRVIAALEKEGVKDEDIETSSFRLYPKQKWNEDEETYETVGYEVIHILKVETLNVEEVGDLLDKAVEAGANGVDRVSFSLTKEKQKEINAQALEMASLDAKTKAESITESLGVRLGKISRISESNFFYEGYDYYPRAAEIEESVPVPKPATQISPSEVEVRANIEIEYEIR
jgi:uncharacterized protein YggE